MGDHPQIYAFTRTLADDRLLVILNFSAGDALFRLPPALSADHPELLIANREVDPNAALNEVLLLPYEARVYRI